jgi:hypothetical protein
MVQATYRPSLDRFELEANSGDERDELRIGLPRDDGFVSLRTLVRRPSHPTDLVLRDADLQLTIRFEDSGALLSFMAGQLPMVADLIGFCERAAPGEVVLVAAVVDSCMWLTCVYEEAGQWRGSAVCRRSFEEELDGRPSWTELGTFINSPNLRTAACLWELLSDSDRGLALPEDFPALVSALPSLVGGRRRMTVKLDSATQWIILLPLDLIARSDDSSMASIGEIEWIVTSKTLIRCGTERAEMVRDLSDLNTVIAHTVVILNDYRHYDENCHAATSLITELLRMLEHVDVQLNGRLWATGLRWLRNPSVSELRAVLQDPDTWYAFAGFHVVGNSWQLGGDGAPFPLDWLSEGDLSHIRMLRTYHCNSIFHSDRPTFSGHSINARLLRAGAGRVEGSTLPETHLTYIAHLRDVLCSSAGMYQVLLAKCMEQGRDLRAILEGLDSAVRGAAKQHQIPGEAR